LSLRQQSEEAQLSMTNCTMHLCNSLRTAFTTYQHALHAERDISRSVCLSVTLWNCTQKSAYIVKIFPPFVGVWP